MNKKLSLILGLILLSGCSLLSSSPSSVVKELISDTKKGDVDAMVSLWGEAAIRERGIDQIRKDQQFAADLETKAKTDGEDMQIKNMRETIQGDRARVFLIYYDTKGNDSVGLGFALIKENGKWKLYRGIDIGEEKEPFDTSFAPAKKGDTVASPDANSTPLETIVAPPPPAPTTGSQKNSNSTSALTSSETKSDPVSGGSLNSKATSLPKPAYPPAAKAAKASGTVVVQVLVDERGNVMTADAVSGHPLLRSAAEQAARIAHFRPTLEGGKPVKVKGTITYQFSLE